MSDTSPDRAQLSLTFGALADPLHKQMGVPKAEASLYQRIADNIVFLACHQFLREAEIRRMRQKLMNLIAQDERPAFVKAFTRRSRRV
jgi:hypothetical protein